MITAPKPMLADNKSIHTNFDLLRLPVLGSTKIDGVRAVVRDGVVYGRSGEPIKNVNIQRKFGHLNYFDGELAAGPANSDKLCRHTCSIVNSKDKPVDEVQYHVFDHIEECHQAFSYRYLKLSKDVRRYKTGDVRLVPQNMLCSLDEVLKFEDDTLEAGFEGVMLRDKNAPYKLGRATLLEGYLMKLKRFTDGEFEVVGFTEGMHNGNEKQQDAFGRSKRSSHKENKTGRDMLGSLVLKYGDTTFLCGAGFTDDEKIDIWNNQSQYLGQLAKVKYFAKGMKDLPRHPTFLSWRDRNDL